MRSWSTLALAAVLVCGLATASHAQSKDVINPLLPTKGTREIAVSGNIQFNPYDAYAINGTYGPFLSKNLQVGASLGYSYSHPDGSPSSNNFNIGPFANYYFPGSSALEPYVGVFIGYNNSKVSGAPSQNSSAYGFQGGVKQFLNSNVAAFAELDYRKFDKKVYQGKDNTLGINIGLAFYMK